MFTCVIVEMLRRTAAIQPTKLICMLEISVADSYCWQRHLAFYILLQFSYHLSFHVRAHECLADENGAYDSAYKAQSPEVAFDSCSMEDSCESVDGEIRGVILKQLLCAGGCCCWHRC